MPSSTADLPASDQLAPAETIVMVRDAGEPMLCIRYVPGSGPSVLYVHGSSFPAALSMNYRIEGTSWADHLHARGFDVWSFDFPVYGGSERDFPIEPRGAEPGEIPGRGKEASRHVERVVRHIQNETGAEKVSIIAHSWGTIPAGLFAGRSGASVDRLILFGPVGQRDGLVAASASPFLLVTAEDQWKNFQSGVPVGHGPPMSRERFDEWASAYIASDPSSGTRFPPSVRVPAGPDLDIAEAWSGHLAYDPALIRSPTMIVRGEWDSITGDSDAAWLVGAMTGVPGGARDCKLGSGAHRMHIEDNRAALFDAVGAFLLEGGR